MTHPRSGTHQIDAGFLPGLSRSQNFRDTVSDFRRDHPSRRFPLVLVPLCALGAARSFSDADQAAFSNEPVAPLDEIKDPYVLEFLDLTFIFFISTHHIGYNPTKPIDPKKGLQKSESSTWAAAAAETPPSSATAIKPS